AIAQVTNVVGMAPGTSAPTATAPVIGAKTKLVFLNSPTSGTVNTAMTNVQVALEDSSNNVVTTAAPVTITLALNGTGTLSGATPTATSSGIATFGNLTINQAGTFSLT